jgi:hypothetical protein
MLFVATLGACGDERLEALRSQGEDGAWNELDSLYTFGTARQIHFRSPLLTTGFALRAFLPRPKEPLVPSHRQDWAEPLVSALR